MQNDDYETQSLNERLNRSQHYKKSSKITYQSFKELFDFEENDRDKKQLKKDFRKIENEHNNKVKFKHLIGMLDQSDYFGRLLSAIEWRFRLTDEAD